MGESPVPLPFNPLGLDHIVLAVRDAAAVQKFYVEVLGCAFEQRQEAIGLTQLRAGRSLIDLVERREHGPVPLALERNLEHFCLRIEPFDADTLARHFEKHGVARGVVAERYGADGDGPSIYVADPEGNIVELKGPPTHPA